MRDFRRDMIDLFERRRGGHVQHWLYTDALRRQRTGSDLWRAFSAANQNYLEEARLIGENAPGFVAGGNADAIVDFGVGSRAALLHKVMPVISGLANVRLYAGVDISKALLRRAANTVRNQRPDLTVETHHADFHHDKLTIGGTLRLGLLFGYSASNQEMMEGEPFPHDEIVSNLRDFRQHLGVGGELLLTYDGTPDPERAMASYRDPLWSEHVTGLMYDVARTLQTGGDFSPAAWEHVMLWDDNAHVIHQCVAATRAQQLIMGDWEFRFGRGERFVAVNNFKFQRDRFDQLRDDTGFGLLNSADRGALSLQHLAV